MRTNTILGGTEKNRLFMLSKYVGIVAITKSTHFICVQAVCVLGIGSPWVIRTKRVDVIIQQTHISHGSCAVMHDHDSYIFNILPADYYARVDLMRLASTSRKFPFEAYTICVQNCVAPILFVHMSEPLSIILSCLVNLISPVDWESIVNVCIIEAIESTESIHRRHSIIPISIYGKFVGNFQKKNH